MIKTQTLLLKKDEIYTITDSIQNSRAAILDKLVEFGVLDQATADEMSDRAQTRYAEMKEDGRMFGPRAGGRILHSGYAPFLAARNRLN